MRIRPCALLLLSFLLTVSCRRESQVDHEAERNAELAEIRAERDRLAAEREAIEAEKDEFRLQKEAELARRADDLAERELSAGERDAELAELEQELADREQQLSEQELEQAGTTMLEDWTPEVPVAQAQPVADYDLFYDELQSYGSWFETPDYGYVYQPTIVVQDSSWRPYTRGRWICSNLGWTWYSDEPFGWACFHYGRWAQLANRGWCWVPGSVWAPSWVCWRQGGSHVGWAPLPPETLCDQRRGWGASVEVDFGISATWFNFVEARHMADPLWNRCLPLSRNRELLRDTRRCTNIESRGDRIIAGGPRYDTLRRQVGRDWPVRRLDLDAVGGLGTGRDAERVRLGRVSDERLSLFAPNLETPWNSRLRPEQVAGRWDRTEVVRGENGVDARWRERFRERREEQRSVAERWAGQSPQQRDLQEQQLRDNRALAAAAQEEMRNPGRPSGIRGPGRAGAVNPGEIPPAGAGVEAERSEPGRGDRPTAMAPETSTGPRGGSERPQPPAGVTPIAGANGEPAPGVEAPATPQRGARPPGRANGGNPQAAEQALRARRDALLQQQQEARRPMTRAENEGTAAQQAAGQALRSRQEQLQAAREAVRQRSEEQADLASRRAEESARQQQMQAAAAEQSRQQQMARQAAEQQQRMREQQAAAAEQARQEQAQRLAEQQRMQQEQQRAAQEQAQRAAEERARQMEAARQQAQRAAEEQRARQMEEARQRAQQQQEQAQRAAEERARQMEDARQRAQQQQEQAQRAAEERARQMEDARQRAQQQQEQAQRAAEERARQQRPPGR